MNLRLLCGVPCSQLANFAIQHHKQHLPAEQLLIAVHGVNRLHRFNLSPMIFCGCAFHVFLDVISVVSITCVAA